MASTYAYSRPALTVDCVVFAFDGHDLEVLFIRRGQAPFQGAWALPGGFVPEGEGIDAAARRELAEETGLEGFHLEQLRAFGEPGRDPRGHTVTIAYYALVRRESMRAVAATDAAEAAWFSVASLPRLAFDHREILGVAINRLRASLRDRPIGIDLLPRHFTLSQLQALYEAVLGRALDKRNFRKRLAATGLLVELDAVQKGVPDGAAPLTRDEVPIFGEELAGIAYLPRIIAKARAKLRGGLDPDLMFGCGGDRNFLRKHGDIHPADFLRRVWAASEDDLKISAWVKEQAASAAGS